VISTQNGDTIWEAYFQANKQSHSLDWVVAAVDIVTHEQVVVVW
jgi:hypothetical protein